MKAGVFDLPVVLFATGAAEVVVSSAIGVVVSVPLTAEVSPPLGAVTLVLFELELQH